MTDTNHAEQQAQAQYNSIVQMLASLDVDYDRLEELRDDLAQWVDDHVSSTDITPATSRALWAETFPEEAAELTALEAAAGDCTDLDESQQRIYEDPLSVDIRSGWTSQGDALEAEEFRILLCTGGPAVQIRGEMDQYDNPCRAWLEYQDWGTPWTQWYGADEDVLVRYASHFFGA